MICCFDEVTFECVFVVTIIPASVRYVINTPSTTRMSHAYIPLAASFAMKYVAQRITSNPMITPFTLSHFAAITVAPKWNKNARNTKAKAPSTIYWFDCI